MSEQAWSVPMLRAAARLYGHGANLRRELRRRMPIRLERPVVSVGNLAVGGRNKTPVVAAVARMLHEARQELAARLGAVDPAPTVPDHDPGTAAVPTTREGLT